MSKNITILFVAVLAFCAGNVDLFAPREGVAAGEMAACTAPLPADVWALVFEFLSTAGCQAVRGTCSELKEIHDVTRQHHMATAFDKGRLLLIRLVAFAPSSKVVVVADFEHSIIIWTLDAQNYTWVRSQINVVKPSYGGNYVEAVIFSPDEKTIAVGCTEGQVSILVKSADGKWVLRQDLQERVGCIKSMHFSPCNSRLVITQCYCKTVRVYRFEHQQLSLFDIVRCDDARQFVRFSPDGQQVAVCSDKKIVRIFDGEMKSVGTPINDLPDNNYVNDIVFCPSGIRVAITTENGGGAYVVEIWSKEHAASTWSRLCAVDVGEGSSSHVEFCADGTKVFVRSSCDRKASVWDVGTGQLIRDMTGCSEIVASSFSRDGKWCTLAFNNGQVKIRSVLPMTFDEAFGSEQ